MEGAANQSGTACGKGSAQNTPDGFSLCGIRVANVGRQFSASATYYALRTAGRMLTVPGRSRYRWHRRCKRRQPTRGQRWKSRLLCCHLQTRRLHPRWLCVLVLRFGRAGRTGPTALARSQGEPGIRTNHRWPLRMRPRWYVRTACVRECCLAHRSGRPRGGVGLLGVHLTDDARHQRAVDCPPSSCAHG